MRKIHLTAATIFSLVSLLFLPNTAQAQLNKVFENMFNHFFRGPNISFGQGFERLYDQPSIEANQALVPAMNSMIASNIAAFPLPSTVAGIYFDFSAGQPEMITESLGPIYTENAETVGRNKLNAGINFSNYSLGSFRGMPLEDMRFTFTVTDLSGDGVLGSPGFPEEMETVDIMPGLNVNANSVVFFATYGITSRLDFGVAVPLTNVSVTGEARAIINSATFQQFGFAVVSYSDTLTSPDFEETFTYDESKTGLGDLSLRAKYALSRESGLDLAALVDVRLGTGDEQNFLGTGETNVKFTLITSKKIAGFGPHLNLSYELRQADFESDQFELYAGFDQKLGSRVTFMADFLGQFALNADKTISLFPGSRQVRISSFNQPDNSASLDVDLSNIPEFERDHILDLAVGLKWAPSTKAMLMGNVIVPLQNGGLRSNVVPMLGGAITF